MAAPARTYVKDRGFTASDGTPIAYHQVADGDGIPIVYVPGLCCTDTYVGLIADRLIHRGHPALVVDNRGHFDSGLPRPPGWGARNLRPGDVSPARMGLDIIELLDDAGVDRAVVVGHSLGVQILFEAYRAGGPARVAGLVPVAGTFENPVRTFANRDLDGLFTIFDVIRPWIPFELFGPLAGLVARPQLGAQVVRAIRAGGDRVTAEVLAPHVARIHELNFAVVFKVVSEMRRHSAGDLLPAIEVPVLVCAGERDVFTPPSVQRRMAAAIPGAELAWFAEGSHFLPVDFADEVAEAVAAWLDRNLAVGGSQTNA